MATPIFPVLETPPCVRLSSQHPLRRTVRRIGTTFSAVSAGDNPASLSPCPIGWGLFGCPNTPLPTQVRLPSPPTSQTTLSQPTALHSTQEVLPLLPSPESKVRFPSTVDASWQQPSVLRAAERTSPAPVDAAHRHAGLLRPSRQATHHGQMLEEASLLFLRQGIFRSTG